LSLRLLEFALQNRSSRAHARRNCRGLSHGSRRGGLALTVGAIILVGAGSLSTRERPPAVQPPKPLALRLPSVRTLPNGFKVVVVDRHSLPLLTLRLEGRSGAEADPPEFLGTAQMVAGLLDEGTERRSAKQIAETIDQVGGTIQTGAEWDEAFAEVSVLTDQIELAFDLLSDMVMHPAFASDEVERIRKQTLSALDG